MTYRTRTGFGLLALLMACTLAAAGEGPYHPTYPILVSPEPAQDPDGESLRRDFDEALLHYQRTVILHSTRIIERREWEGRSRVKVPSGEAITTSAPDEASLNPQTYRASKRIVLDLLAAFRRPDGVWTGALHDDSELSWSPQPDIVSDGFFLFVSSTEKGLLSDVYWNEAAVSKRLLP